MKLYPMILEKMILPLADRVVGTEYSRYIRRFSHVENFSRNQIIEWQNRQLGALIEHVYKKVPFYRDYMKDKGLVPHDIRSVDDLALFPEVNKTIIRENFEQFVPDNLRSFKYTMAATGGSTGEPLKYYVSYETQSAMWAKRICILRKFGFQVGEKYLALGSSSIIPDAKSSSKSSLFHQLLRMVPLSAANMDDAKCVEAVDILRRNKIRMIYGYASAIYLLAKYVLDHDIDLYVDICVTTSEKLTPHYEEEIRKAFDCSVMNEYGAREGGLYSYRCENGRFHMIETCLYRLGAGETKTGSVLTTNLINYAMPFINYNVEDVITVKSGICECGDNSFIFEDVVGRESQIMTLANGRTVTGPAFTVLFSGLPVKCYQIVKAGDCAIELRIQRGEGYSADTEKLILKSLQTHAGEDCSVIFNYDHIFVPLKNGKLDYFVTN